MVEQSKHVCGGVIVAEGLRKNAGATVAAEVRQDQLKFCSPLREGRNPILTRTGKTVQQQERLAGSMNFEVDLLAIEGLDSAGRTCGRHRSASFGKFYWAKIKPPAHAHGRLVSFFSLA